jgi:hypothetical protein
MRILSLGKRLGSSGGLILWLSWGSILLGRGGSLATLTGSGLLATDGDNGESWNEGKSKEGKKMGSVWDEELFGCECYNFVIKGFVR